MAQFNITTPAGREKIKREAAKSAAANKPARRSYYPQRIDKNRAIGWRYLAAGTPGHWAVISHGKPEPLGTLEEIPEDKRYGAALKLAQESWSEQERIAEGASTDARKMTLRRVMQDYFLELERQPEGGHAAARAVRAMANRFVTPYADKAGHRWIEDPVAKIDAAAWKAWREWMAAQPVMRKGPGFGQPRKGSTVNRDIASVRAALNQAARVYKIADQWTGELKRDGAAEEGRGHEVYLDAEQRAKLTAAAAEVAPEVAPLAAAMLIVPVRPGALASLKVGDYNRREHAIWIEKDKANGKRRVALPQRNPDGSEHPSVALLAGLIANKLPGAPLFSNRAGGHWRGYQWNDEIKKAAAAAGLPEALTIYWLRHSRITDLVTRGVAPMAIAKMAGTSVEQIEKTYHHLIDDAARDALMAA